MLTGLVVVPRSGGVTQQLSDCSLACFAKSRRTFLEVYKVGTDGAPSVAVNKCPFTRTAMHRASQSRHIPAISAVLSHHFSGVCVAPHAANWAFAVGLFSAESSRHAHYPHRDRARPLTVRVKLDVHDALSDPRYEDAERLQVWTAHSLVDLRVIERKLGIALVAWIVIAPSYPCARHSCGFFARQWSTLSGRIVFAHFVSGFGAEPPKQSIRPNRLGTRRP